MAHPNNRAGFVNPPIPPIDNPADLPFDPEWLRNRLQQAREDMNDAAQDELDSDSESDEDVPRGRRVG